MSSLSLPQPTRNSAASGAGSKYGRRPSGSRLLEGVVILDRQGRVVGEPAVTEYRGRPRAPAVDVQTATCPEGAGLDRAAAIVLSFDNIDAALRIMREARLVNPDLPVLARAADQRALD